jgi:hypothetical protein
MEEESGGGSGGGGSGGGGGGGGAFYPPPSPSSSFPLPSPGGSNGEDGAKRLANGPVDPTSVIPGWGGELKEKEGQQGKKQKPNK